MDMSNATAAGPSYGLLDVIFGTKPKEAESEDGKEFGGLMNLIKALNKGDKEEASRDLGRTLMETSSGGATGDSRGGETPDSATMASPGGPNAAEALMQERQMRERMAALHAIAALPVAPAVSQQAMLPAESGAELPPMRKLDVNEVNRALSEKRLPTLNESEQKLLAAVNAKLGDIEAAKAPAMSSQPAIDAAATAAPMAALTQERAQESQFAQALAKKGIDPRQIKSGETLTASAAPEKFLTTESYLKMHESFGGKPKAPEAMGAKSRLAAEEISLNPGGATPKESLTAEALEGAKPGSKDFFGRTDRDSLDKLLDRPGAKPGEAGALFGASLADNLRSDHVSKDVFLPGTSPEEMKPQLLGEVQQGVHFQAVKGGGEMRLVIHPEALGEVKLKVGTKDGKVSVEITAENSQVAQVIRSGSQELESSLRDQNLSLAKLEVNVSSGAGDGVLASLDAKSGSNEQFLSQNSQNGMQQGMNRDEGRFAGWDQGQNQRPGSGFGSMAEESGRSAPAAAKNVHTPVRDNSRRLDVVA